MTTATTTRAQERAQRWADFRAERFSSHDRADEAARLLAILEENATAAISEGNFDEAQAWALLGTLRVNLRLGVAR